MDRYVRVGASLLIVVALSVAWRAAFDVYERVGRPFPGFLLYENGVVGPPFLVPQGAAYDAGIQGGDRVVAVDGAPIASARAVWEAVGRAGPGGRLGYTFERPDARRYEVRATAGTFTPADFRRLVLPLFLGGLLLLVVASVPVLVRPGLETARIFFLFSWGFVTNYCFLPYDYFAIYRFMPWGYVAEAVSYAALLHFALIFPQRRWPLRRWPRASLVLLYAAMAGISAAYVFAIYRAPSLMIRLDRVQIPLLLLSFALLAANVAHVALRSPDALERQRARVVLVGPALAVATGVLLLITFLAWRDLGVPTAGYVAIAASLPLSIAYGMLKHNLFEFGVVVRRGLVAGSVVMAVLLGYLGAFAVVQRFVGGATAWASAALSALILVVLVPVMTPLRRRVEGFIESAFFPERRRAVRAVHGASRALARLQGQDGVARLLREAIAEAMDSRDARVLAGGPAGALAEIDACEPGRALVVPPSDPLAALLREGETVNLEEPSGRGDPLARSLRRHLERLGVRLVVPFPPNDAIAGGFLLGARADGRLYTSDDETLLETLAAQSVVALENAHALESVHALERRLAQENVWLRQEIQSTHGFDEIVGASEALRSALAQLEQVAPTDAAVLVYGETGTGKELVANAVHERSRRRERPLVKVACAAIPETLLESELFGHERGAFTGAAARKLGRFEVADGGTLFLDDVDTLPLAIQAKLLRAIQEGEVQRLGSNELRVIDVRIVAASNRNLIAEVHAGRFREDLYYRLNVVPLRIPPLRERREDIPLLVAHFLARESQKLGREFRGVADDTMEELLSYAWPGNVRELRNVIERAIVLSQGDVLRLPGPLAPDRAVSPDPAGALEGRPLAERVRSFKIEAITRALEASGGHQRRAAELLGLHPPSLSRMLRELGIQSRP